MFERLDVIRLDPARIVDIGCGHGHGLLDLRRRFQQATVLGIDCSVPNLNIARSRLAVPASGFLKRLRRHLGPRQPGHLAELIAADQEHLPIAASTVDLIWSNLCLHWSDDPLAVIDQWHRIVRPGGLLMFSMFGVDTLAQLRSAGAGVMPFNDMHDIGDALVAAGFADPVMDMNMVTVNFSSPEKLLSDVHALGGNALAGRCSGLSGKGQRALWLDALLQMRDKVDGQIPLSFEVCFGHAWCPDPKRLPKGLARVEFQPKPTGR